MSDTFEKLIWELDEALIEHKKQGAPDMIIDDLAKAKSLVVQAAKLLSEDPI